MSNRAARRRPLGDLARGTTTPLARAGTSKEESAFTPLRWSPTGRAAVLDGDLLQAWSLARADTPGRVGGLRGEGLAVVGEDCAVVVVATGVRAPMRAHGRARAAAARRGGRRLMLLVGTGEVLHRPAAGRGCAAARVVTRSGWRQGHNRKDMFIRTRRGAQRQRERDVFARSDMP